MFTGFRWETFSPSSVSWQLHSNYLCSLRSLFLCSLSNRSNPLLKCLCLCVCVAFFCGWLHIGLQTGSFWLVGRSSLEVMMVMWPKRQPCRWARSLWRRTSRTPGFGVRRCAKWIITYYPYPICPSNEIHILIKNDIKWLIYDDMFEFKLQEVQQRPTNKCWELLRRRGCCTAHLMCMQEIGTMTGKGHAMVVVRPGSLRETTQVLEACLEAGVAIVPQGRLSWASMGRPGAKENVASWYGQDLNAWNWFRSEDALGQSAHLADSISEMIWSYLYGLLTFSLHVQQPSATNSWQSSSAFGVHSALQVPKPVWRVARCRGAVIGPWWWSALSGCRRSYPSKTQPAMPSRFCASLVRAFSACKKRWSSELLGPALAIFIDPLNESHPMHCFAPKHHQDQESYQVHLFIYHKVIINCFEINNYNHRANATSYVQLISSPTVHRNQITMRAVWGKFPENPPET